MWGFSTVYRTISFRLPARRSAAAVGAAALAAGAALTAAPAVQAAPGTPHDSGAPTATVLRAKLDVSLLGKTVDVPVDATLDDVRAPGNAEETALTVTVGHGVALNRPITLLSATVATAEATADRSGAEGYANLAHARLHLPGLPLLSLLDLDAANSRATCRAGHRPTASSHLTGVTVLGQHVSLKAIGTTEVNVPGVGRVDLDLTHSATTSATAAATALRLKVRVNPLSLGVADVSGDIVLARATCRTPHGGGGGSTGGTGSGGATNGGSSNGGSSNGGSGNGGSSSGAGTNGSTNGGATSGGSTAGSTSGAGTGGPSGSSSGGTGGSGGGSAGASSGGSGGTAGSSSAGNGTGPGTRTAADTDDLAATGADSSTPYLAVGAGLLVAAGTAAFLVTGRRRRSAAGGSDTNS